MATTPSSQKKKAKKQQRRSIQDSPSTRHQWVHHPSRNHFLVPSSKQGHYHHLENDEAIFPHDLPGGLIDSEKRVLYASLTTMQTVDIGAHIPVKSDSILIHPLTMETCGIAIATPVLVENAYIESAKVTENMAVCRAWPIASIQLDVVVLGPTPLLSVQSSKESLVKVSPLPSLTPQVAGQLELEPRESADEELLLSRSFQNYLLHMHVGYCVCVGSYLSVQYYGEERYLLIRHISPLEPSDTTHPSNTLSPIKEDLSQKFTNLSLSPDSPPLGDSIQTEQDDGGCTGSASEGRSTVQVYKVTVKTKITVQRKDSSSDSATAKVAGPTLSSFAGGQKQVQLLKELVLYPLENPQSCQNLAFPRGVLLYGPPGVGKSLLAHALSNETSAHSIHLSASELLLGNQNSEGKVQEAFTEARERSPTLILLDDLHLLCPHRNTSPSETERKSTAALITCLDSLVHKPSPGHIVVIATTNQIERVEPSLRRPGRFDREVELSVPSAGERKEILRTQLRVMENDITEDQLTVLADSAHGYVGADLLAVCADAQHKALHRALSCEAGEGVRGVKVGVKDVRDALREIGPSAMREVAIEVPKVHWRDIGGQETVKQRMREAVEWPLKHPESFHRLGVCPPRGVLLFGPPGCSKTMVARALATESGLNFIAVKGPELFSKWVGDSERAVRQVFSRARAAAPAIIFFDEIDALAVQRKSEGSSVADRVLAQLLTEMDGVETLSDVLVVAATNRPDMIDKALLRPGRIDRMIYVPLPDDITRRQILQIQFRKTPVADDVDVDSLVAKTQGYSGAEVVSLCQEAALCAMHEDITCSHVSQRHFSQALETVKPQTDQTTIEFYEKYSAK